MSHPTGNRVNVILLTHPGCLMDVFFGRLCAGVAEQLFDFRQGQHARQLRGQRRFVRPLVLLGRRRMAQAMKALAHDAKALTHAAECDGQSHAFCVHVFDAQQNIFLVGPGDGGEVGDWHDGTRQGINFGQCGLDGCQRFGLNDVDAGVHEFTEQHAGRLLGRQCERRAIIYLEQFGDLLLAQLEFDDAALGQIGAQLAGVVKIDVEVGPADTLFLNDLGDFIPSLKQVRLWSESVLLRAFPTHNANLGGIAHVGPPFRRHDGIVMKHPGMRLDAEFLNGGAASNEVA